MASGVVLFDHLTTIFFFLMYETCKYMIFQASSIASFSGSIIDFLSFAMLLQTYIAIIMLANFMPSHLVRLCMS